MNSKINVTNTLIFDMRYEYLPTNFVLMENRSTSSDLHLMPSPGLLIFAKSIFYEVFILCIEAQQVEN